MRGRIALVLLLCFAPLLLQWLSAQDQGARRRRRPQPGIDLPDTLEERLRVRAPDRELARAGATRLAGDGRARRSPFVLARPDGRTTLGILEWTPSQGDRIVLHDLAPDGRPGPRRVVNETPAEIVRPMGVLDAAGRAWIFWTELEGVGPQLRATHETDDGFVAPVTLTTGELARAPNLNVEAVLHEGRIHLAWESGARRDVLVAALDEKGALHDVLRAGAAPGSDLDPVLASSGGKLWLAWVEWGGRDYEIRLRSVDPRRGALGEALAVSADSESDDLHPTLAAAQNGDLWLAWDRIEHRRRGDSTPPTLRMSDQGTIEADVCVALVRDGAILAPPSGPRAREGRDGIVPGASLLSPGGGVPRLALDAESRPWIAYRRLDRSRTDGRHFAFPLLIQRWDGRRWSDPLELAGSHGMADEPALLARGDGVLVAAHGDARLAGGEPLERVNLPDAIDAFVANPREPPGWLTAVGIALAQVGSSALTTPAIDDSPTMDEDGAPRGVDARAAALVPRRANLATPHFHPYADRLDDPIVTGEQHLEVTRAEGPDAGETFRVYWGDLHRHSSVSRCGRGGEPQPGDRWDFGRDVHLYDFMALTDHANHMDPFTWWQLDKLVWLQGSDRYCTLSGFEWSTVQYGHHNVILPGRLTPLVGADDALDGLYARLRPGECVTIPHHSADASFAADFFYVDDRFTRLIEVYQARRGSYEFDGCFKQAPSARVAGAFVHDALEQGLKLGIVASSDHGYGQSYACVLAKSLDRKSLFEALLARRTYGATAKGLLVDLQIDGAIAGEELASEGSPRVRLRALGAAELADVVVFRDGRPWQVARERGSRGVSLFAPVRLAIRLPPRAPAPERDWTLDVSASQAGFELLEDRRDCADEDSMPGFTKTSDGLRFRWPAGFSPTAGCNEFAVHVRAAEDATFLLGLRGAAAAPLEASYAALAAKPVRVQAPGGECVISIQLGDTVIDLEQGLGTKEFHAEWIDERPRPGRSWYYARIVQVDGEMAWSSPIFVTTPRRRER